jgi:PTH1 family peptidyl-tRNA hydrolase
MYKLIVGLGNPGEKYKNTRHNYGFMAVDAIASELNFPRYNQKFHSEFTTYKEINGTSIILLKPQTFMNHSGVALRDCVNFYKIRLKDILVIHDDIDLELGKIKIKADGGNGGHNGLKSIDDNIGHSYFRLRFGIGKPTHKSEINDYVLKGFTAKEFEVVDFSLEFMAGHLVELLFTNTYDKFLNNYAIKLKKIMEKNNGS